MSDWEGAFAAATACGTAVAPYLENFDNGFVGGTDNNFGANQGHNIGATISPCWTRTDTDTNYRWGGRTRVELPLLAQGQVAIIPVALEAMYMRRPVSHQGTPVATFDFTEH